MVLDILLRCCHFLPRDAGRQFLRLASFSETLEALFPAVRAGRSVFHLSCRPFRLFPWLKPIEPASRLLHAFPSLCVWVCVCLSLSLCLSLAFFTSLPISTPCFWQKKSPVRSSGMILDTPPFSSSTTSSFNSTSKTLVVVKLIRSYLSYHSPFPHGSRSSKPHSHILSHLRFRI
jgi:hypothetical protein